MWRLIDTERELLCRGYGRGVGGHVEDNEDTNEDPLARSAVHSDIF